MFSLFETSTPQVFLDIDRTKAQLLGVRLPDVFRELQTFLGSSYVNDFNLSGRKFRVTAQADEQFRLDPKDIWKIRVRNQSGDPVPLASFATLRNVSGPYRVPRYNLYPAAELDGAPAPDRLTRAGAQDHGTAGGGDIAARFFRINGRHSLFSRSGRAIQRCSCSHWQSCSCFWCWSPRMRSLTLPACRDPDRADVLDRVHRRRDPARPGQQHPDEVETSSC